MPRPAMRGARACVLSLSLLVVLLLAKEANAEPAPVATVPKASAPAAGGYSPASSGYSTSDEADLGGSYSKYDAKSKEGELYPPTFDEEQAARALQWVCFMLSLILAAFYLYNFYIGTCKWEVLYVAFFECVNYVIEIWYLHTTPVTLVFKQGHKSKWIRYTEWLLTCPIILVALSRVGVAEGSYSKRTMRLLTSDQGTILMGVTASFAQGYVRLGFYLAGCVFGFNTFYTAAAVYLEAWRNVPDVDKEVVKWMAVIYYASWLMFPILFAIGKEGLGYLTMTQSVIGHSIADILSKNIWGLLEFVLEVRVHTRYHEELHALEEEGEEEEDSSEGGSEAALLAAAAAVAPYTDDHRCRVALVTGGPWTMEWFGEKFKGEPFEVTRCANLQVLQMAIQANPPGFFHFALVDKAFCGGDTLKTLRNTFGVPAVVFAEGGPEAAAALQAQWGEHVEAVVAAPQQGETYPGNAKSMLKEWHAKFTPHGAAKKGHQAHHPAGKADGSHANHAAAPPTFHALPPTAGFYGYPGSPPPGFSAPMMFPPQTPGGFYQPEHAPAVYH